MSNKSETAPIQFARGDFDNATDISVAVVRGAQQHRAGIRIFDDDSNEQIAHKLRALADAVEAIP